MLYIADIQKSLLSLKYMKYDYAQSWLFLIKGGEI